MTRFVIVGAGPAGTMLAFLLARRGARVSLLERHTDFEREFRGEVLMPSGVAAFEQVGLGHVIAEQPASRPRTFELWRANRRLMRLSLADLLGDDLPRAISQPLLLEAVCREAAAYEGFRLQQGFGVRRFVEEAGRVAGVVDDEGRRHDADLVIGADGRYSVLARQAGFARTSVPQTFDIVWCKLPLPEHESDGESTLRVWLGNRHFALAYRTYDERLQLAWVIDKGAYGDLKRQGMKSWVAELAAHLSGPWGEHVRANLQWLERAFLLSVTCDRVDTWTRPGLLVIGDAAHPMSPVGAQGLNIALRDAVVAANHLEPLVRREGSADAAALDAAAERVAAERLPEVRAIQAAQQGPPELLFSGTLRSRLFVDRVLPMAVRMGFARRFLRENVQRFAFGVGEVRYGPSVDPDGPPAPIAAALPRADAASPADTASATEDRSSRT